MVPLLIIGYLLVINLLAFVLMGWDKRQAKRQAWRKSEQSLLTVAALGGSLGIYAGSRAWHHKTQKQPFKRYFYGIVLVQLVLLLGGFYLYYQ